MQCYTQAQGIAIHVNSFASVIELGQFHQQGGVKQTKAEQMSLTMNLTIHATKPVSSHASEAC